MHRHYCVYVWLCVARVCSNGFETINFDVGRKGEGNFNPNVISSIDTRVKIERGAITFIARLRTEKGTYFERYHGLHTRSSYAHNIAGSPFQERRSPGNPGPFRNLSTRWIGLALGSWAFYWRVPHGFMCVVSALPSFIEATPKLFVVQRQA